jgi:hypothetical protein
VSRPICWAPVALLLGRVRNLSRVDWCRAVRIQIRVDEGEVGELVVGVVVDVLGHVRVEHRKRGGVGRAPAPAGDFAVLDAAELVVLLPGVGLEGLGRSQEAENRRISRGETAAGGGRCRLGQQPPGRDGRCPRRGPFEQEGTTAAQMLGLFGCFHDLPPRRIARASERADVQEQG